jgi:hypothetical protein
MNDLEICTRIAEIENIKFEVKSLSVYTEKGVWPIGSFAAAAAGMSFGASSYNPLTDDGLCFKLMKKYKVSLIEDGGKWEAEITCTADVGLMSPDETCSHFVEDKNPNKAICLAIIKANKDK